MRYLDTNPVRVSRILAHPVLYARSLSYSKDTKMASLRTWALLRRIRRALGSSMWRNSVSVISLETYTYDIRIAWTQFSLNFFE